MNETEYRVIELIREIGLTEIEHKDLTLIDDLGFDSLKLVMLLVMIEENFGIELDESDMDPYTLLTVEDVIRLVFRYVKEK
ncbi:MAG: acyl carrier protein [Ruminococcaceae bacterium]|nr:acyl carrier protein [Oscillospiraceae bacterium]